LRLEGHVGIGMIIAGVVFLFYPGNIYDKMLWIWFAAFIGMISWPDLDLRFELSHRGFTHTLAGALVFGIVGGFLFGLSNNEYFLSGFIGGFSGTIAHMFGDILTYQKFRPLWPLSNNNIALGLFRSNDKSINLLFGRIGIVVFISVLVYRTLIR